MFNLKVCVACLEAGVKMRNIDECENRTDFNIVACLSTYKGDGLPPFLCYQCNALLAKFIKFRDKCQRSNYILKVMLSTSKQVTLKNVNALNKEELGLTNLSFMKPERSIYKTYKYHFDPNILIYPDPVKVEQKLFFITVDVSRQEPNIQRQEPNIQRTNKLENVKEEPECLDINMAVEEEIIYAEDNDSDVKNEIECDDDHIQCSDAQSEADGMEIDTKYATVVELSKLQQKAAADILKGIGTGKFKCSVCNQGYSNEEKLKAHVKGHDKMIRGPYLCEICQCYYKTDYILNLHIQSKHLYKYLCKECPEVNYTRSSAKKHYAIQHEKKHIAPAPRVRVKPRRVPKMKFRGFRRKFPKDFLKITPIDHMEQYQLIEDRKMSKNYLKAVLRCELCFRGFRNTNAFANHLKKHDPAISGPLQCDPCKLHFKNTRKLYKHMNVTHLYKYSCQICDFVCYCRSVAQMHYRWHNNVTYKCEHCNLVFSKSSTRLTHIRIKHPSTAICTLCGHSFVSDVGLYFHKQKAHTKEEIEIHETELIKSPDPCLYCSECDLQFLSQEAYTVHLGSSSKHVHVNLSVQSSKSDKFKECPKTRKRRTRTANEIHNNGVATSTKCEECGELLRNDVQARSHYKTQHPGTTFLKRYMCDVCGHTTQQYNNLLVHMRTHTQEKPYACKFCDRRFSMPSNRDRHLVVHTGEKRFECHYCQRRFSQSSAVKLHIQTVHLKIPYAPWDKRNRKRRKVMEINIPQSEPKLHVDTQGAYLNAYISYHDE